MTEEKSSVQTKEVRKKSYQNKHKPYTEGENEFIREQWLDGENLSEIADSLKRFTKDVRRQKDKQILQLMNGNTLVPNDAMFNLMVTLKLFRKELLTKLEAGGGNCRVLSLPYICMLSELQHLVSLNTPNREGFLEKCEIEAEGRAQHIKETVKIDSEIY